MPESPLILSLVLAVIAAFVGGTVAQRLGQPVIVGYLAAGVVIGPFTSGVTASTESVSVLAEIGVMFLMFALGAEFSLGELRRLGRVASLGAVLQLGLTMLLGPLLAPILGLTMTQGLFLGALLALSSTVVVSKILMARGESQSLHGRIALGILIAQDLAVVPMVIILPAIAAGSSTLLPDLALAAVKALAVLAGAFLIGARAVPWLLGRIAITRSRELFVLGVVALALGTAIVTELAGLSPAFGAFLAGLVVAESDYRTQVIAEVLPLRDLFVALFFVSVGMLIDPALLFERILVLALVVVVAIVGKGLIGTIVVMALGMPGRVGLLVGLSLVQVGEFSFVLARIGVSSGAIPQSLFDLILGTAVITIVLTPFLMRASSPALLALRRAPLIGGRFQEPAQADPAVEGIRRHVVICGFGRVARELADALDKRGFPYVVVEYNPSIVWSLRARGTPVVYGDAGNPVVLDRAGIHQARLLAALVPDPNVDELAVHYAHSLKSHQLDIVARVVSADDVERMRKSGASAVVQPEFEGGVEVIRHVLRRFGIADRELNYAVAGRRAAFYRRPTEG